MKPFTLKRKIMTYVGITGLLVLAIIVLIFGYLAVDNEKTHVDRYYQKTMDASYSALEAPISHFEWRSIYDYFMKENENDPSIRYVTFWHVKQTEFKAFIDSRERATYINFPSPKTIKDSDFYIYSKNFYVDSDDKSNIRGILKIYVTKNIVFNKIIKAVSIVFSIGLFILALILYLPNHFLTKITQNIEIYISKMQSFVEHGYFKGKAEVNSEIIEVRQLDSILGTLFKKIVENEVKIEKNTKLESLRLYNSKIKHDLKPRLKSLEKIFSNWSVEQEIKNECINTIDDINKRFKNLNDESKIEEFNFETVNFSQWLHAKLNHFSLRAHELYSEHNLEITHDIEENIFLELDEVRFADQIYNLLHNAIEAAELREQIKIHVSLRNSHEYLILSISDNGTGIPKENSKLIYEPHFTTKPHGQGLGLAQIKNVIRNHHYADITHESSENGTTFYITWDQKFINPLKKQGGQNNG